ncbi:glycosyltransferase [Vibrio owensii]|uniref:glycosyltransferase n=1 Tax=Vibrio owensii TaxID=696485 RepID=UPI0018F1FC86|nr:glycosyltransferase [Vibrio owensii]
MNVIFNLQTLSREGAGLYYATRPLLEELSSFSNTSVIGSSTSVFNRDWGGVTKFHHVSSLLDYRDIVGGRQSAIVHTHGLWGRHTVATSLQCKLPLIISPHGMLDTWAMSRSKIKKRIALCSYEGLNFRRAKFFHALCSQEADDIMRYAPSSKIYIAPNGVSDSQILETRKSRSKNVKFLYLGRLDKKKGVLELLNAWAKFVQKNKSAELHVAGWGELESVVKSSRLNNLFFHGSVFGNEKVELYDSCDYFLLPSYSEGLPMTILEASARGLVCGYSEACNLPHELNDGLAFRCEPDIDSILRVLFLAVDINEDEFSKMSFEARQNVKKNYSWNTITKKHLHYYEKC